MHGRSFDRDFLFCSTQLIAKRLVARLKRKNRRSLFSKFDLETIDRVAFLAELGKLACAPCLELLDPHLQTPTVHCEFCAKLILVGLNLGHGQWRCGFKAAHRQPYCAIMHEWNDNEPDERGNEKPDPEIHDRFNHGTYVSNSRATHCHSGRTVRILR